MPRGGGTMAHGGGDWEDWRRHYATRWRDLEERWRRLRRRRGSAQRAWLREIFAVEGGRRSFRFWEKCCCLQACSKSESCS